MPSLPIDHTMRVEAYRPEFEAESTAVSTTKFMMSPAYGMPMPLNTSTNGLSPTPALRHGISAHITVIEPMKKSTRRHRVVWMAFGTAVCGSLVSPAVTPMSSVPENAKLTVRIVRTLA